MMKFSMLLMVMTALLFSVACSAGNEEQGDMREFVLEDAFLVTHRNFKAQLESDTIPYVLRSSHTDDYKRSIEEMSSYFMRLGNDSGMIDQVLGVRTDRHVLSISSGKFNFKELEGNHDADSYLLKYKDWFGEGAHAWFGYGGERGFLILPEQGLYISADHEALGALRDAYYGGVGLASETSAIGKLLTIVDLDALDSEIRTDCSLFEGDLSLEGCLGTSRTVLGGDDTHVEVSYGVLFDSAENAETAASRIQEDVETELAFSVGSVEFSDLNVIDDVVTFKVRNSE